ncbi:perlucin-like [Haliotis rufescens]|uniref:perlucin-like n=1 Tax=Haliotis rufescens TaxID=6454 RepID=UPI00201F243C|nr:perlucin-like [Haliotis rufescens]
MLLLLILLSLVYFSSSILISGYGTKWMTFKNVIVQRNVILEIPNIGNRLSCVGLCLQNETCVSVFYRQQHQRCQLHDVLFMSPQDGQQETGTEYYSVTTGGCPSTYVHNRILNICYQVHLSATTLAIGVADCNSRGEHFIVIDSEDKNNHVFKQVNSSSASMTDKYHIDGSDAANEGKWLLHDGRVMTYFAWASGYPRNTTGKHYLVADISDSFRWRDRTGLKDKLYICERDI